MPERELTRLADLTTLRVGGPAQRLVYAETTDELVDAVREVDDAQEQLLVVAGGSNLLVSDEPLAGTVVQVGTQGVVVESSDDCAGAMVRVAAGHCWDQLVQQAVDHGWVGVEGLSGIPGSVGATPIQNVGAYGQEVAETIAQVRVWDRAEEAVVTLAAADCNFGYRRSAFKDVPHLGVTGRYVVLDVLFQFRLGELSAPVTYTELAAALGVAVGDRVPLAQARAAVLSQRQKKGMVLDAADHDTWSAGSFFTNPLLSSTELSELTARVQARFGPEVVAPVYLGKREEVKTSAAWLIERAGFAKGFGLPGPASLSTKHTLALTNRGQATAADLLALARQVRDGVQSVFGIELTPEPLLVGCSL